MNRIINTIKEEPLFVFNWSVFQCSFCNFQKGTNRRKVKRKKKFEFFSFLSFLSFPSCSLLLFFCLSGLSHRLLTKKKKKRKRKIQILIFQFQFVVMGTQNQSIKSSVREFHTRNKTPTIKPNPFAFSFFFLTSLFLACFLSFESEIPRFIR